MQNFKNYLSQLSKRDKFLLFFSLILLSFVIIKFLLIETLVEKNKKLSKKMVTVSQQDKLITTINNTTSSINSGSQSANQLINKHLKQNASSNSLKQIRKTSDGSQRFELEDIEFSVLVKLLQELENNSLRYKSLQINKAKENGIVDATMLIQ